MMEKVLVNRTPMRTSENYQINYATVDMQEWKAIPTFSNVICEIDSQAISMKKEVEPFSLVYGNGEKIENQMKTQANVKMHWIVQKTTTKDNVISFCLDSQNSCLIDCMQISVKENQEAYVTIRYVSAYNKEGAMQEKKGWHNGMLQTRLEKNAKLHLTILNLLERNTTHLLAIENELEENASLDCNIVDFGGDSSITNYYGNLKGKKSQNELHSIYLGTNTQTIDMNYVVHAKGEASKVIIEAQGALKDEAHKHFKGTIDFKKGAKKAEGNETEYCMLLSKQTKSISLPMLLCEEEDVVGNHATASGKVDRNALFYLMTRGITEKEAKILLVKAKFQHVLERIRCQAYKEEVLAEIEKRIGE